MLCPVSACCYATRDLVKLGQDVVFYLYIVIALNSSLTERTMSLINYKSSKKYIKISFDDKSFLQPLGKEIK